jgi:hypothetical protein
MTEPPAIDFTGSDEELERRLVEFARLADGWVARDLKRGGHVVAGGVVLSTNPNAAPWRIRAVRENGRLSLRGESVALPAARARASRLAAFRRSQLEDFLSKGVAPAREPFAGIGHDTASIAASFAWIVGGACASIAAAFLALLLPALWLMRGTMDAVAARARLVEAAGALPLPSAAELASAGFGDTLGAAVVFSLPIAFLAGLFHALALAAGEAWARAARLGQASCAAIAVFLVLSFLPVLPFYVSIPAALLVPLAAQIGYGAVWGRRAELRRVPSRPRAAAIVAAIALAGLVSAFLVPSPASGKDLGDALALFRDRAMLGNGIGKAAALFYYRHTLSAAEPVKEFYALDDARPARSIRTARVRDEKFVPAFRWLGFAVVPGDAPCDFEWTADMSRSFETGRVGTRAVAQVVDRFSREEFKADTLRSLNALAWRALYYAGPLFLAALFAAVCSPWISIIFRTLQRRVAVISILVCFVTTGGLVLWDYSRKGDLHAWLRDLRDRPDAARIVGGLGHASEIVRHEAAYRAFLHPDPSLADPLLRASDEPDLRIRLWAVAALGKTGDARALPKLLQRLDDRELLVRYRAAEGLGFLGNPEAIDPLVRMMKERSWYEGEYALQALRRIAPGKF